MTAVDNTRAAALTKLAGAITGPGGEEAIQSSGGFEEKMAVKGTSRTELEDLVRQTNRTAGAIAEEQDKPEIMDSFRMPHGSGDEALKARALVMAKAIGDLALDSDFAAHALPGQDIALLTMASDFIDTASDQGMALGAQVGATKMIPIHEGDQDGGENARCRLSQCV